MLRKQQAHVVILGGGFGGLAAARELNVPGVRITLIDKSNHHLFQPLLYQVATAALAAPDVSAPIRQLLWRQRNVTVLMGVVQRIEVEKKRILFENRHLDYDYLVVATGMTHAYFGNDKWAAHAPGLKTVGDALDIRRRILRAFESAELETTAEAQRAWTTFVVIGGGPTGVELAGALAEIAGRTLARDFRRFDPQTTRVILIEAGPRVLGTFPEELSRKAHEQLNALGIEVRTGARVTDLGDDFVELGDECDLDPHRALGGGRAREPAGGPPRRAARQGWTRLGRGRSLRRPIAARCSWWAISSPRPRTASRCPGWPSWPSRAAGTPPRTSASASTGARACRFATSTRARWPPSVATGPWRRSAASSPRGSSPGGSGSPFTCCRWSAFEVGSPS